MFKIYIYKWLKNYKRRRMNKTKVKEEIEIKFYCVLLLNHDNLL